MGTGYATGRSHATAAQDVRENGGTLDIFDQQRDHVAQFGFSEGMAEGARPVDVVDCWMGILQKENLL